MMSRRKDRFVLPAVEKCKGFWNGRGLLRGTAKGGLVNQTGATQYDKGRKKSIQKEILSRAQIS